MKKAAAVLALCIFLSGCFGAEQEIEQGLKLRTRLLSGDGCQFSGEVTADYEDYIFTCTLECTADTDGNVRFTVTEPESISGIAGEIAASGGKIIFDDAVLAFPVLAEGNLSPISAPWVVLKALCSGFISSVSREGENYHLSIDDSFDDDAVHTDIWVNKENIPVRGEILWEGRKVLSMDVTQFSFV